MNQHSKISSQDAANQDTAGDECFVINATYLKEQAKEAMVAFAMPVLGIVAAASGTSVRGIGRAALGRDQGGK